MVMALLNIYIILQFEILASDKVSFVCPIN